MVKTRRGVNSDPEPDDRLDCDYRGSPAGSEDKEWSTRELRSNRYRVSRTLDHWPAKLSRRLRTIKMPRIMFPESDTEPEKYSRRARPMRVFFEGEPTQRSRRIRNREPKNYMEDTSEDKPIQQNVRRSGRQRKLLHHSFNESWITNELKVKGYPGLYGCQASTSSDCSSGDEAQTNKRPTTSNGPTHMDEDTQSGSRLRRTSARCSGNRKLMIEASDSDHGSTNADNTVIQAPQNHNDTKQSHNDTKHSHNDTKHSHNDTKHSHNDTKHSHNDTKQNQNGSKHQNQNGTQPHGEHKSEVKMESEEEKKGEESEVAHDSESNQGPTRSLRLRRPRQQTSAGGKKGDSQSESESSDSGSDIMRQPRRSNRTRKPKPTFVQLTKRPTRQAKTYTIRKKPYSLRERKPPKMLRRKTIRSQSPTSSSSSSSSSDTEDLNVSVKNKTKGRQKSKSTAEHSERALREIQPVEVDGSVRFTSVGGLEEHIQCLREMVLFPLMYPDIFQKFRTRPAKGVLFHGPPGTGKTLLARALANECSQVGGRKVAFFVRKGADCLKKWVGESERHIKLLFQQANKMKPSIIFFDEIDALAPVRSVRQEQVHTSVVGTLLAEVDGLCDRGEVIVIGATNRLDAVDPALRRAGRFDRELYFPPPHTAARKDILHIYTKDWTPRPKEATLELVAGLTNGYGGSDLKALCSEAVLKAFRRVYPQVYESEHALVIDPHKVDVKECDLLHAMDNLVACGARTSPIPARALSKSVRPLLQAQVDAAAVIMKNVFALSGDSRSQDMSAVNNVMLLSGECAESHVAPALLATLERFTVRELSMAALHSAGSFTQEQALISIFSECRRADRGCVLFVRDVVALWSFLGPPGTALFTQLWRSGACGNRTLMLCTASVACYDHLPEELLALFPKYKQCVYSTRDPTLTEVIDFLRPIIIDKNLEPPVIERSEAPPPLPRAPPPPPPRESDSEIARRKKKEDYKLRELRIFLRDICRKLAANRRFYKFTKPVDLEEVTDYLDIVKDPMDLETMMTKVDQHRYNCAKEFLQDIDLICANALEYNPDRTSSDKQIRHEACSLRDHAHALIEVEMDSDFELECQEISKKRRQGGVATEDLPSFIYTSRNIGDSLLDIEDCSKASNGTDKQDATPNSSGRRKRRRVHTWAKGFAKRPKTAHKPYSRESPPVITDEESKENKPMVSSTPLPNGKSPDEQRSSSEESVGEHDMTVMSRVTSDIFTMSPQVKSTLLGGSTKGTERASSGNKSPKKRTSGHDTSNPDGVKLTISKVELENVLLKNAKHLRLVGMQALLDLHAQIAIVTHRYFDKSDRSTLPAEILAIVNRYTQLVK